MEAILELEQVSKHYENFSLEEITFRLPRGMIYGMIGENGAGKSTTISSILDMIETDGGSIRVFGLDHQKEQRAIKQKLGVVMDGLTPFGRYYIKDIPVIMQDVYENWDNDYFETLLQRFSLPKQKKIKDLSKGMAVKLNFAIALSHHAELLILDEATSGLDPVMRDEILELLQEFVLDENHSILFSTHITSDLDKIADFVIFLHQGKLQFVKSKEELDVDYGILHCGEELLKNLAEEDKVAYLKEDYGYRVLVRHKRALQESIRDLMIEKATIEDIMLFYIKGVRL